MLNAHIVTLALCALLLVTERVSAISYDLNVAIHQNNTASGDQSFDFGLTLLEISSNPTLDNALLEIISPTGQRFGEQPAHEDWIFVDIANLVSGNVGTLAGTWTLEENLPGGTTYEYQFVIPDASTWNFRPVPAITSPANGAVVDKVFDVTWTNASPGSFPFSAEGFRSIPEIDHIGTGHVRFSVLNDTDLRKTRITDFTVETHNGALLNVEPLNSGSSTFFRPVLRFATHSAPISFTIIPEPASLMLVGIAIMCATGGRGFVRGDG